MSNNNDLLKGALIGGVLGGVAALFLASKSGKELRNDICEGYDNITCKGQELANDIKEKGNSFLHVFGKEIEEEEESDYNSFLIGGAIGAVIGATAALLLAPQSGDRLRTQLGDQYEAIRDKAEDFVEGVGTTGEHAFDQLQDWKDTFFTIAEKLSSHGSKKGKHGSHSKFSDLSDWANLGIRLYQQLQNRK
ncbi:MAG: YtxH domain-containing protein [Parachlamydiaceae bacterium]|nr:YtxH domain-containing protein [Parachlamydiaceae bacterium]